MLPPIAPHPALVASAAALTVEGRRGGGGTIVLHAYDVTGKRLNWSAFRALQENGKGTSGDNDVLLDPTSLRVRMMWPLFESNGDPALTLPAMPAALALAWPTSEGYSNLIVDLPATGGTYVFNILAAEQAVRDVDTARTARPSYAPSPEFVASVRLAHTRLTAALASTREAQRGAAGARALDAAVHAMTVLLSESGAQEARASRGMSARAAWGVTFDDISSASAGLQSATNLFGRDGWVRIVFNRVESPNYYRAIIANAHRRGLHVLGQLLDSSDMAAVPLPAWQKRVRSYVDALPSVDAWEVGNEVNGSWLGTDVSAKVSYGASYVKRHTHARTLVTLYWQLGESSSSDSMFSWAAANLPDTAAVDDIGISLYPEDHPMGEAFERVMTTLHARYPTQRLLVTELGYWSADLGHTWWWGSQFDPYGAGRNAVAALYQSAAFAYPYAGGGAFWWYYLEEAAPSSPLWQELRLRYLAAGG
ncbi:MAG: hypothetical protein NVSMB64_00540 [Candidatus Velthaea sp.]